MPKAAIAILTAAALIAGPAGAQQYQQSYQPQPAPSGGPLSSIFSCAASGNAQGTGAILGALAGGAIGNNVASDRNRTTGTILGAALGAAAGSYIGCRMQVADAQKAQQAAQAALDQGRSQSWTNTQTGASGRIDVVNTYNYGNNQQAGYGGQSGYNQQGYGPQPVTMQNIGYAQGIEIPREYQPSEGQYQANGQVNIRSGPSERARVVGSLRAGETIDALVRVEGTPWVLAVRNGMAVGYVSESVMRLTNARPSWSQQQQQGYPQQGYQGQQQQAYNNPPPYDPRGGPQCRTFDQTYTRPGGQPETQRYTACRGPDGQWLIQS